MQLAAAHENLPPFTPAGGECMSLAQVMPCANCSNW